MLMLVCVLDNVFHPPSVLSKWIEDCVSFSPSLFFLSLSLISLPLFLPPWHADKPQFKNEVLKILKFEEQI